MKNIKINKENYSKIFNSNISVGEHWLSDPRYGLEKLNDKEKLLFLLILDSTSFSYWGKPNWRIEYEGERYNGAKAMIFALRNAIDNKLLELNAEFLMNVDRTNYRKILKGTCEIPLFEERYEIIRKIGRVLVEKFDSNPINIIKEGNYEAQKIITILKKELYFFEDSSLFEGEKIYFDKKVQLFILDIFRVFKGKGVGNIKGINKLSACADYKLPQVLRKYGIFEYSNHLANLIDKEIPLPKDSIEEIEIRKKTIEVVYDIARENNYETYEINDYLWLLGQETSLADKPYHKTRITKY